MEISPIFEALFSDRIEDKRYYQVYGGRGSSKSFSSAVAAVVKTYSPFGHKILYLRQTMTTSEDSTIADVKLVMGMMGVSADFTYKSNLFTNKITGSTISFKGIRASGSQTAKLKSLSGITTVIIEEAEELDNFDEFSKIDESIRVKDKPLKIILVYNPTSAVKSWIHEDWFTDGLPNRERFHDTVYLHSTYLDNLDNLAVSTVKRYRDLEKTNPIYYKNTILAEWTLEVQGRMYAGWSEYPCFYDEGQVWYGLDFGYQGKDHTALVKVNYFEGVYYVEEIFSRNDLSISDTVQLMKQKKIPYNALIVADSAAPTLITEIRKGGFKKIRKAKKGIGIEAGIKKVQDMPITLVGDNKTTNVNLYYGYMTFKRDEKGNLPHEPDILAALRYALTYIKTMAGGVPVKSGAKLVKTRGL